MRSGRNTTRHGFLPWVLSVLSALFLLAALSGCQKGLENEAASANPTQTITADLLDVSPREFERQMHVHKLLMSLFSVPKACRIRTYRVEEPAWQMGHCDDGWR